MTLVKDIATCPTSSVRGLSRQIIAEMNLLVPNVLMDFRSSNIVLADNNVHPFLQATARSALREAVEERGQPITINSAYRTVAQQHLLRRQFEEGRCRIAAAAQPGRSNHEDGLALDVDDFNAWKPFLENNGWEQLGPHDPVHFTFVGGGTRSDIGGIGVRAFQHLWNVHSPTDRIAEDGAFGAQTRLRLDNSPAEGFPVLRLLRLAEPPMQGEDVRRVQQALANTGLSLSVDGAFGAATERAVRDFQEANGLAADGIVGPSTRRELGLAP